MNINRHTPAVAAMAIALGVLLLSGLNNQGQISHNCTNCSTPLQEQGQGDSQSAFDMAYQLTEHEAQALARLGWINATY
ncbi:hypothetical protein [Marinobacterium stanieri]|uniref:hypothetical protein n=1 Tax=Marinobacterium stanieri TaxID=49186 RepID=UPI000255A5CA|nr:hypothetical protein [Marinobacterium stanieri]